MDEDDLLRHSLDPRNISGVHNYCDRWCERCPFADRCVVNAMVRPFDDLPDGRPVDPLLQHLKVRFAAVREHIDRRAAPIELSDEAFSAAGDPVADRAEAHERENWENDPLVREAHTYCALVDAWFEAEADGIRAYADALAARAETEDVEAVPPPFEMDRIIDGMEIVRWDRHLIHVKVYRAVSNDEHVETNVFRDPVQTERNGSAKVALLAMDRSEASWRLIDKWYPSSGSAALLVNQLVDLRMAMEARFPHARRFLRPGFDGLFPAD